MPLFDYSKVLTFVDNVEAVSVTLHHALIKLRDHAAFGAPDDPSVLRAAEHLSSMLEDAQRDVERLIDRIERR